MLIEKSDIIEYTGDRTHIMVYKNADEDELPFSGFCELPRANDFGSYQINHITKFDLMPGDIVVSLCGTVKDPQVYKSFIIVGTDEDGVFIDESLMNDGDGIEHRTDSHFASYFLGQQVRVYRGLVPVKKTETAEIDIDQVEIKS